MQTQRLKAAAAMAAKPTMTRRKEPRNENGNILLKIAAIQWSFSALLTIVKKGTWLTFVGIHFFPSLSSTIWAITLQLIKLSAQRTHFDTSIAIFIHEQNAISDFRGYFVTIRGYISFSAIRCSIDVPGNLVPLLVAAGGADCLIDMHRKLIIYESERLQ